MAGRPRPSTASRGYGHRHQQLRRQLAVQVAAGGVTCARCGELIRPGDPWDLGHDDHDRTHYSGPEHRRCNRATANRPRRPMYQDDLEARIFWGPPPDLSGRPVRWSRAWYDWRDPGGRGRDGR
jgi:hypothetical protein